MTEPNNINQDFINSIFKIIWSFPQVKKVILFGSYAKHTATTESDLDIAVFVNNEDYSKKIFKDINLACSTSKLDIQVQLFSLDDLTNPCGIIQEIIEHGIDIASDILYSM